MPFGKVSAVEHHLYSRLIEGHWLSYRVSRLSEGMHLGWSMDGSLRGTGCFFQLGVAALWGHTCLAVDTTPLGIDDNSFISGRVLCCQATLCGLWLTFSYIFLKLFLYCIVSEDWFQLFFMYIFALPLWYSHDLLDRNLSPIHPAIPLPAHFISEQHLISLTLSM